MRAIGRIGNEFPDAADSSTFADRSNESDSTPPAMRWPAQRHQEVLEPTSRLGTLQEFQMGENLLRGRRCTSNQHDRIGSHRLKVLDGLIRMWRSTRQAV